MRRIYLFIFACIFASLVSAQRNDSLKVVQGTLKECYLLSDIDSITHSENQDVNIYHNSIKSSYSITSIDSISLQHAKGDAPSCSTISLVSTTDKSAVVKCSYNNIYNGIQCGVMVSSDNATMKVSTSNNDGEREISISGLQPATTYNYWAYIEVNGIPENGEVKSFTTNPPDVSGTWTCTEKYYFAWDKNYENPQYKDYPVILGKDGTVSIDGKSDYVSSSWSYGANGRLTIKVMDMATSDFNSGFDINLTADEAKNPKKFTGTINNWSFNSTIGYVSRGGNAVVLTR